MVTGSFWWLCFFFFFYWGRAVSGSVPWGLALRWTSVGCHGRHPLEIWGVKKAGLDRGGSWAESREHEAISRRGGDAHVPAGAPETRALHEILLLSAGEPQAPVPA